MCIFMAFKGNNIRKTIVKYMVVDVEKHLVCIQMRVSQKGKSYLRSRQIQYMTPGEI